MPRRRVRLRQQPLAGPFGAGLTRKVETAIEPRFQAHFVEAMAIPHKTADYPNLRKVVDLPVPKPSLAAGENRDRRAALGSQHRFAT